LLLGREGEQARHLRNLEAIVILLIQALLRAAVVRVTLLQAELMPVLVAAMVAQVVLFIKQ
jgi:hypothetical protein